MDSKYPYEADELLAPVQRKRKRTGKACASCRRRKTRCTGGIPCDACRIGEMTCSYDDPDRRMTAIEYIQSLEKKVEELEGLLNGDGPRTLDEESTPPSSPEVPVKQGASAKSPADSTLRTDKAPAIKSVTSSATSVNGSEEDVIETMVGADEASPLDTGPFESHRGSFAGLSLLQRMQNLCKIVSANQKQSDAEALHDDFMSAFDIASEPDSTIPIEAYQLLPSRASFDRAVEVVMDQSCCNMQFLDPTLLVQIGVEVYKNPDVTAPERSRKSFALLYSILALSRRFEPASPGDIDTAQNIRGLRYFRMSRSLLDPANCRDLPSLQTLLCMILYTQVSSMISTCYSYICMAVAAALQMGLFTEVASKELPEPEKLHRRRIYSVLNIMDTYVTTALGLPRTLRDVESDHVWPLPAPPESIRDPMAGTYAHATLIQILAAAVETNHPVTRPISEKNGFYGVEYSKITATDDQLKAWFANLPQIPAVEANDPIQIRSQLSLRLAYAHVQMVLYRPFLHHALRNMRRDHPSSLRAYACGSACINAAMQVVWLAEALESNHVFSEAHWFTTLIISYTAACLVLFVVMSNKNDPTFEETEAAVRRVKNLCYRHANQNASMQRCYRFLETVHPTQPSPYSEAGNPFNRWNREVSNTFSSLPDDAGLEAHGEDVLQALSLPQFPSFLNTGI